MKRTEWKSEEERLRWNNVAREATKLAVVAMAGGVVIGFLLAWWLL